MKQTDYPLSYSSDSLLVNCARKYELYKLLNYQPLQERHDTIHTTFGSAIGDGVAYLMHHPDDLTGAYDVAFRTWSPSGEIPLYEGYRGKSLVGAFSALEEFQIKARQLRDSGWVIASINGKPASEVSFKVILPNYGHYVGYIDVIMMHPESGRFMVVECKTMGASFHPAKFMNSKQDVGYLAVAKTLDNFESEVFYPVLSATASGSSWHYSVYERTEKDFEEFYNSLLISFQSIRLMDDYNTFPRNGRSCMSYSFLCPAYGDCHKSIPKRDLGDVPPKEYDIVLEL